MSLKTNIPILLKLSELFHLAKNKQKLKTGVFLQQEPGSEAYEEGGIYLISWVHE